MRVNAFHYNKVSNPKRSLRFVMCYASMLAHQNPCLLGYFVYLSYTYKICMRWTFFHNLYRFFIANISSQERKIVKEGKGDISCSIELAHLLAMLFFFFVRWSPRALLIRVHDEPPPTCLLN